MAKRGFGSVDKLPSGRWRARYRDPNGKRRTAPRTFPNRKDAERWLKVTDSEIALNTWTDPDEAVKAPQTFGEYVGPWLEHRTVHGRPLRPTTRTHYQDIIDRYLLPAFADRPLPDVTPGEVARWHAKTAVDKHTMRAHAYSLLRTVFNSAVHDGHASSNPCQIEGAGKADRATRTNMLSPAKLAELAAAMPAEYRVMVLIAGWGGLRFGELAELRRKDVDGAVVRIERAVYRIPRGREVGPPKSSAGVRSVTLPPPLVPLLAEHIDTHALPGREGLLFPSPTGTWLPPSTFYESYWAAREAIGRPDLRFHDLRHVAATTAAQQGATIRELQARLGHSTAQAAMRYQEIASHRDAELADRLGKLWE